MKLHRLAILISLCFGLCDQPLALEASETAYYRFPGVRADSVVFTAEGDIWKVGIKGGQAQRLTTHPAAELYPSISQDGQWLAFSAAYEGAIEAYVMPINGGLPTRLSFENDVVNVLGWTAQGEVLISTQNSTGPGAHRIIAAINPKTMARRVFPVADANEATLDDSGRYLYFTRFGLQITNDNAKHYRGGATAQMWRYDLQSNAEATHLFPIDSSNNKRPMWWQGRLYFVSDRDGSFNIWSASPDGSAPQQLTHQQEWEVRNAAMGDGNIVYQSGADLHVLDLHHHTDNATNADQPLAIKLVSDFDQERAHLIKSPLDFMTYVDVAGKGDRLVFTARGHVTVASIGKQRRIDLAIPIDARARNAVFSADQKHVYAIVDSTGENEIWQFPTNGIGESEKLTKDGSVHRLNLHPSPDGKWLAHTDKRGRLWLLDLVSKTNQIIDDAGKQGFPEFDNIIWSQDSHTIAIVRPNTSAQRPQIGLYSLTDKQLRFVTSDHYESRSPVFSGDGHWLYFLSDRNFKVTNNAPWGDRNLGPGFDKRTNIFAIALQPKQVFPFKAEDELHQSASENKENKENKESNENKKSKKDDSTTPSKATPDVAPAIDYKGLSERLYQVPLAAGNYRNLVSDDKRLYFMEQEIQEEKGNLKTLAISNTSPKAETFASGIRAFDLSADKKHIFYQTASPAGTAAEDFIIVDTGAKAPSDLSQAKVTISDWSFIVNPRQEWREIFNDAWRMHRDYFYDEKMRGVDWNAVRQKYTPLVERVTDRAELNDVLAQMASEVGALHSQLRLGDQRKAPPEGAPASLGAVLRRTVEGVKVDHIYRTEQELPAEAGPLMQPDVDVKEGDVILAVNGQAVNAVRDIADLLINQADKQVLLRIKRDQQLPHDVIVMPVSMKRNADLRYTDWEQSRRERVNQASHGKIGYLHLRAMGPEDMNTFARDFYSNIERDGLIIDVRRNRGGNIDSWIIEKLLRKAWAFWSNPVSAPSTNMQQTFRGHLVVLVDELTYSDGETFAAGIKALKLAPLVGRRTAGAGVWLSDGNSLADNGMIRAAENAQFSMDGQWLVEGVGVIPDVDIENLPHATFNGQDQQLEIALKMLQEKLQSEPVKPMVPRPFPSLK
ncbi:S41 family peptidase [Undibacterium sp. RuRC25W]|uniref:S41 family peptidase n=1 Tax=Undibacterium sp. RuRC25W TaxID=3413047 RepID=UPI003BF36E5B